MADSPWPAIAAERKALADDLANLTPEQWQTPSLCDGRTVHQALAHQVATARTTPVSFFRDFLAAGFRFSRMSDKGVAAESAGGPARTLAEFRSLQDSTSSPPGPSDSWLGEAIVHAEDIRRPLHIRREYPSASVTRVLEFYLRSNALIGGKRRAAGLTLRATDTDWERGSGPLVEGPALSLLLAVTGRTVALSDLSGPGRDILASR